MKPIASMTCIPILKLQYANRAKSIENNVIKNENVNDRMIRQLKEEIEKLKQQVTNVDQQQVIGVLDLL